MLSAANILLLSGVLVGLLALIQSQQPYLPSREENELTLEQRNAVNELRNLVAGELTEEFMKEEYFLAKWLNKRSFKVQEALPLLQKYLTFRSDQKLNTILDEDWNDMKALFPYSRDTTDKMGRPVLYVDLGKWNAAKFLQDDASMDRMIRYLLMYVEESEEHVRRLRADGSTKATSFRYIVNAQGFDEAKLASPKCMQVVRNIAKLRAPFHPADRDDVVVLNAPHSFNMLFNSLSEVSRAHTTLYGQDRDQWEPKLLIDIERDQFPKGLLAHA